MVRRNLRVKSNGEFTQVDLERDQDRRAGSDPRAVSRDHAPHGDEAIIEKVERGEREERRAPIVRGNWKRSCDSRKSLSRRLIEELETSNEELTSTNEELQSTNEELQSTNEELETSKEELQSLNEELTTVNAELQSKLDDLARSTRRHAEPAQQHPGRHDLPGRRSERQTIHGGGERSVPPDSERHRASPVRPVVPAGGICHPRGLPGGVEDACCEGTRGERRKGAWYRVRIMPYRTSENVIDGVVVTLMDIDRLKKMEHRAKAASDYFESIVQTVREPLLVLDADLKIVFTNASFCEAFRVRSEDVKGTRFYEVGERQWDIPELRRLLDEVLPERKILC